MVDKRFKDAGPRDLAKMGQALRPLADALARAMEPISVFAKAAENAPPTLDGALEHFKDLKARGERGDIDARRKASKLGNEGFLEAAHYFDLYGPHKGAPGRPRGPRGKQFADTDAEFEAEAKQRIATGEAIAEVINDIAPRMEGASLEAKKKRLRRALRAPQSEV